MKRIAISAGFIVFITGCVSVQDKSIQLSESFSPIAERYSLKRPGRLPGSGFSRVMGGYSVTNHKVGEVLERKSERTGQRYEHPGLLEWLFDKEISLSEIDQYNLQQSQSFSYDFRSNESVIASSKCESYRFFLQEVKKSLLSIGSSSKSSDDSAERKKTLLVCTIGIHEEQWHLILNYEKENPLSIQLKSNDGEYRIEEVSNAYVLLEDRKGQVTKRSLPSRFTRAVGSAVFNAVNQQVAAYAYYKGEGDIWINKHEPDAVKELMLAAGYALILFNWIDDDWRY